MGFIKAFSNAIIRGAATFLGGFLVEKSIKILSKPCNRDAIKRHFKDLKNELVK